MAKNVRLTKEEEKRLKKIGLIVGEKTGNKTIAHLINSYERIQEELTHYKDRTSAAELKLTVIIDAVNKRNHLDEYIKQQCE